MHFHNRWINVFLFSLFFPSPSLFLSLFSLTGFHLDRCFLSGLWRKIKHKSRCEVWVHVQSRRRKTHVSFAQLSHFYRNGEKDRMKRNKAKRKRKEDNIKDKKENLWKMPSHDLNKSTLSDPSNLESRAWETKESPNQRAEKQGILLIASLELDNAKVSRLGRFFFFFFCHLIYSFHIQGHYIQHIDNLIWYLKVSTY